MDIRGVVERSFGQAYHDLTPHRIVALFKSTPLQDRAWRAHVDIAVAKIRNSSARTTGERCRHALCHPRRP
jgi:hypothetical protein